MKRWLGDRDTRGIIRLLQRRAIGPKDVVVQQEKVKAASALAFIAPMYFVGFPAMLKGWIERVFTLGFAFGLTPDGWRGDIGGRIPLLTHEKALIIQTTIFDKAAYDAGLRDAMRVLIDEFASDTRGSSTSSTSTSTRFTARIRRGWRGTSNEPTRWAGSSEEASQLFHSFLNDQRLHASANVVADSPNAFDGLTLRVVQWPVIAAHTRHVRTLVATPHRDQKLRLGGEFRGELLRASITEVNRLFLHHRDNLWVNTIAGSCSCG